MYQLTAFNKAKNKAPPIGIQHDMTIDQPLTLSRAYFKCAVVAKCAVVKSKCAAVKSDLCSCK